ncbi:MAG: polyphosphate kinase 1 [Acidobacteria bacterium]|nr:polyphosphate kinase 1 [Acidobacteriota bacterium]
MTREKKATSTAAFASETASLDDSTGTSALDETRHTSISTGSLEGTLLFNRELSWIEFNRRVLEEGIDHGNPLLERLKFLAIFSTNLDEFFMIRVSGLMQQVDAGVTVLSPDGLSPANQLKSISEKLRPMTDELTRCIVNEILPELDSHGIRILRYKHLTPVQQEEMRQYFQSYIFPILTPLAVDPSHPFPYISNLSLNLAMMVRPKEKGAHEPRFARLKVPPIVARLLPVSGDTHAFVFLEEVIAANVEALFPEMHVTNIHPFRVTRDADLEIEQDEAGDLLKTVERQLRRRRFGSSVRLEIDTGMPPEMAQFLTDSLGLESDDVFTMDGPLSPADLMQLYKLDFPALKDEPFAPVLPAVLRDGEPIFDVLRKQDVVLHHPFDSFAPVVDFVRAAARDPHVLAIKQTLYRTSGDSPIVEALMDACERGKQVAVLVELKARFDEENNIVWARKMERAGVHVVYGLIGLKTHCKLALVVRQEGDGLRRYVHLGTGNYNPATARIYTDIGLLTSNPEIGADATELFNFLTGYSRQTDYRKLFVAPVALREKFIGLIRREADHCRAGKKGRIVAKINSLTDTRIIRALYDASQAGVEIELIVRGVCCLRPGIPGISENIRVRSIVGRFLEHSRIFLFHNDGKDEIYLGSADWMNRNLDRRVETVFPVEEPKARKRITKILDAYLLDTVKSRVLDGEGAYERITIPADKAPMNVQEHFLSLVRSDSVE